MTAPTRDEPMRRATLRRLMKAPDAPPRIKAEQVEMNVRYAWARGYLSTAPAGAPFPR